MRSLPLLCAAVMLLAGAVCAGADDKAAGVKIGKGYMMSLGGSHLYYTWLKGCLKDIRSDIPSITKSAENAASRFVEDGFEIGAWGDAVFVSEFTGRAGGIMPLADISSENTSKSIVLMTLRKGQLDADLHQADEFARRGNKVIIFAREALLRSAPSADNIVLINTHASRYGGLLSSDGNWVVPTDPAAGIAALWTWTGEFIAACTRLGSAPPMWQSIMVPGAKDRNAKSAGKRLLDRCPPPVPPGKIARDYLDAVEKNLDKVYSHDAETIRKVALIASEARAAGNSLYAGFMGHALEVQLGCEHDTGLFELAKNADIKPKDFVVSVGYDRVLKGQDWGNIAERARKAGASILWSFTSYNPDEVKSIQPGELYIDQRWALGDAAVSLPGYDVKILPPSGVIGQAIFWSINAEILRPCKK